MESLYEAQKQLLVECENKIKVFATFDKNKTINSHVRTLLFGKYKLLLSAAGTTLQHQTLALAIYMNILCNFMNKINKSLLYYGNTLVFNGLLNIKHVIYKNNFSIKGEKQPEETNKFNLTSRYSLDNPIELNNKYLQEDFQQIENRVLTFNSYDIIAAIYGLNLETQSKMSHSEVVQGNETCTDYINNLIISTIPLFNIFTPQRFGTMFGTKSSSNTFELKQHFQLQVKYITNSDFLNTTTTKVNKYYYVKDHINNVENGYITINGNPILLFSDAEKFSLMAELCVNDTNRDVSVTINDFVFGVMMTYDFEEGIITDMPLGGLKNAIRTAQDYENGMIVVFRKSLLPTKFVDCTFRDINKDEYTALNCIRIKSPFDEPTYIIHSKIMKKNIFRIENIHSIIYNNIKDKFIHPSKELCLYSK